MNEAVEKEEQRVLRLRMESHCLLMLPINLLKDANATAKVDYCEHLALKCSKRGIK